MKQLIDPKNVRKGDLIRWEQTAQSPVWTFEAVEWTAKRDGDGKPVTHGQHYLLDRPKPAVVLPTEPTFGWATWSKATPLFGTARAGNAEYGMWRLTDRATGQFGFVLGGSALFPISASRITAFASATAVPTDALDKLRTAHVCGTFKHVCVRATSACAFLAAVDAANGPTP